MLNENILIQFIHSFFSVAHVYIMQSHQRIIEKPLHAIEILLTKSYTENSVHLTATFDEIISG